MGVGSEFGWGRAVVEGEGVCEVESLRIAKSGL